MGAQQRVFGCNGVYTLTALVVGLAYRLVDFRKFSQFFQVVVHLLVADDRERLVSFKLHVLVFVKYRPAVVVQFDDKAVSSLYGGDFYMPVPNVAPFEVVHVRIAQPTETAEQKDVPYPFEILLGRGYLVVFQFVQFFPCEEYHLLLDAFQLRVEALVGVVHAVPFLGAPPQEPFQVGYLLHGGRVAQAFHVLEEIHVACQLGFVQCLEGQFLVELLKVFPHCGELLISGVRPAVLCPAFLDELPEHLHRCERQGLLLFLLPLFAMQVVESLLHLCGGRHSSLNLERLEDVLYFRIVAQQVGVDFGCALFQFVGAARLYTLLVGVPFGCVDAVARCKLNALAGKYHTHTDRHILHDWYAVLLPAFQRKDDVSLDIHIRV